MAITILIKKTHPDAKIPVYAHSQDAGVDLYAVSEKLEFGPSGSFVKYDTGIAIQIPEDHFGLIVPRSSLSNNTTLILSNSAGIIDSNYRGSISVKFRNTSTSGMLKYKIGERIAQLLILPYSKIHFIEVPELSKTDRDQGAYGSTGK